MKHLIAFLLLATAISACQKEAPTTMLNEMVADTAILKLKGSFENGPYGAVTGTAHVYKLTDGKYQLKLQDFNTSNGPDLKVYLSKEIMPVNFINLGNLKSTNGNQVYDITDTPDFTQYKYACIHCKAYNHLFGYALLQ